MPTAPYPQLPSSAVYGLRRLQRACAALRAISLRCSAVSRFARVWPPMRPRSLSARSTDFVIFFLATVAPWYGTGLLRDKEGRVDNEHA